MRTGYALLALMGLGLIFDVPMWPNSADIKPEQYSYVTLNATDSANAIQSYRKTMHLNNIGFYKEFFPLSSQKLTAKMHVWFIVTYLSFAALSLFWFNDASDYSRDFVMVFAFLSVGNLFDYMIIYNDYYTGFLSYNILSIAFYIIFLIYKGWRQP